MLAEYMPGEPMLILDSSHIHPDASMSSSSSNDVASSSILLACSMSPGDCCGEGVIKPPRRCRRWVILGCSVSGDEGTDSGDPADEPLDISLSLLGLPIQGALISGPLPPVANPLAANPGLLGAECPGEDIRSGSDSQLLMPLISGLTFCGVKVGCADCRGVLLRALTALLAPA